MPVASRALLVLLAGLAVACGSSSGATPHDATDAAAESAPSDSSRDEMMKVVDGAGPLEAEASHDDAPTAVDGGCGATGTGCSGDGTCCSKYCKAGTCTCNSAGYACTADADCCPGLSCEGLTCTPPSTCTANGASCTSNAECCSAGCVSLASGSEVCCAPIQSACVGDGVSGGCCNGSGQTIPCTAGVCCVPLGGADGHCSSASDCCSPGGVCADMGIIGHVCCVTAGPSVLNGQSCITGSDCCSGVCTARVCVPPG